MPAFVNAVKAAVPDVTLQAVLTDEQKQQEGVKEYRDELKKYRDIVAAAERRWSEVLKKVQTF